MSEMLSNFMHYQHTITSSLKKKNESTSALVTSRECGTTALVTSRERGITELCKSHENVTPGECDTITQS